MPCRFAACKYRNRAYSPIYLLKAEVEFGVNFATLERIGPEVLASLKTALQQEAGDSIEPSHSGDESSSGDEAEQTMRVPEALGVEEEAALHQLGKCLASPSSRPDQDQDLMQLTLLCRSAYRLTRTPARQAEVVSTSGRLSPVLPVGEQVTNGVVVPLSSLLTSHNSNTMNS